MKPIQFMREVASELRMVEWTTRKELIQYTFVVVFYSFLLVITTYILDTIFVTIRNLILGSGIII